MKFEFSMKAAKKLLIGLVFFEVLLVFCYLLGYYTDHPTKFFNLDGEANLPAWFSSMQLFLIGQTFLLKNLQINSTKDYSRKFFYFAAAFFIFLSLDEVGQIHETMNGVLKGIYFLPRFDDGNGIWIFIYVLLGLAILFMAWREFVNLIKTDRFATLTIIAGITVALFGGVFLEILSYQYLSTTSSTSLNVLEVALEEFCEMLGGSTVLYGALLILTS